MVVGGVEVVVVVVVVFVVVVVCVVCHCGCVALAAWLMVVVRSLGVSFLRSVSFARLTGGCGSAPLVSVFVVRLVVVVRSLWCRFPPSGWWLWCNIHKVGCIA